MATAALQEVRQGGVPNYFDDQRFGSVSGGEFVAKALVLGDFEQALRLALAAPYEHDRKAQKQEKAILSANWGSWDACKDKLPHGHARNLVNYLVHHPADFRGAIARLRPELRGLYLSVYQSHLWNRMLERWLREHCRAEQLLDIELSNGKVPMHRRLEVEQQAALAALQLQLPSSRGTVDPLDARTGLLQAILDEEGLTREQLKIKGLRELFFSRGDRAALCVPAALQFEAGEDECNNGRLKLALGFELARGSYATLIVKKLFGIMPDGNYMGE